MPLDEGREGVEGERVVETRVVLRDEEAGLRRVDARQHELADVEEADAALPAPRAEARAPPGDVATEDLDRGEAEPLDPRARLPTGRRVGGGDRTGDTPARRASR